MKDKIKFIRSLIYEIFYSINIFQSKNPLTKKILASRDEYEALHKNAQQKKYPEIEKFEDKYGYHIDTDWFENLALHTQVVVKKSDLNYPHGRILYSSLMNYLEKMESEKKSITILETGTARGFSALCMAKALVESKIDGNIFTIDTLPHDKSFYWNCIDDHEGPKSRKELLKSWPRELGHIIFIQGQTRFQLPKIRIKRINFAFLDATHDKQNVLFEYNYIKKRQSAGDKIVFDDVTPGLFDGVVGAVNYIESEKLYDIEYINASNERGYAIATRKIS